MTDKKLTDNEIIKALEDLKKCNHNEIDCSSCALRDFYPQCPEQIGELSLDLINRQKAEIERLQEMLQNLYTAVPVGNNKKFANELQKIKAEAYKEFAEELHNKAKKPEDICDCFAVGCSTIDNLLQEKIGE